MITFESLNIPPECWEWIADQTRSYRYNDEIIEKIHPLRGKEYIFDTKNPINSENTEILESFIYQAIDGINNKTNWEIDQNRRKVHCFNWNTRQDGDSIFKRFDSSIAARLDTLRWIYQREAKK